MKKIATALLVFAVLGVGPALAQSSAPANGTLNIPQLTIPSQPAAPAATKNANPPSQVKIPADPAAAFTAAVAAYEKGNFADARALFAGAEKKSVSASLEYNFGNACYQADDYGAAILHYLRALSLDPRDPDARQNLALARTAANAPTPDATRLDRYSALLGRNSWTWLVTIAGWSALYLAFLPSLFRWRGALPWLIFSAMFAITIAGGIGWWGAQQHAHDGVVLQADASLLFSPTANSPAVTTLQNGEVAQTLEQHGEYYKVHTMSGATGWVAASSYAPVWK